LLDPLLPDLLTNKGSLISTVTPLTGYTGSLTRNLLTAVGTESSTAYLAFRITKSGLDLSAQDFGGITLGEGANQLFVGDALGNNQWSLSAGNGALVGGPAIMLAETVHLVLELQFKPGADLIRLFVNPPAGSSLPSIADVTLSTFDFNAASSLLGISFGSGAGLVAPSYGIDGIRVGALLSNVLNIPEPSTGLLLGVATVLLAIRRR
jgi:hypothetical protein